MQTTLIVSCDHVAPAYRLNEVEVTLEGRSDGWYWSRSPFGCSKSYPDPVQAIFGMLIDNGCTKIVTRPPRNKNMDQAPRDGTLILIKRRTKPTAKYQLFECVWVDNGHAQYWDAKRSRPSGMTDFIYPQDAIEWELVTKMMYPGNDPENGPACRHINVKGEWVMQAMCRGLNVELHEHLLSLGYVHQRIEADVEDTGDGETGPMITGHCGFDEYTSHEDRVYYGEDGQSHVEKRDHI